MLQSNLNRRKIDENESPDFQYIKEAQLLECGDEGYYSILSPLSVIVSLLP